jgi:hypothetical protein
MIQFRRGSTTRLLSNKTKLAAGQPGYDKDKHKLKIGDGEHSWFELPYASGLNSDEILSSEESAKGRFNDAYNAINSVFPGLGDLVAKAMKDSPAVITYGTESPDENTVGQMYLQYYDTEPEVDYIVAYGTNNGWTFQKWHSGIAKCWCTFTVDTTIASAIETGSFYHSNSEIKKAYPFAFTGTPSETATVQSPSALTWLGSTALNTAATSGTYKLICIDKQPDSASYRISISAEGRWR